MWRVGSPIIGIGTRPRRRHPTRRALAHSVRRRGCKLQTRKPAGSGPGCDCEGAERIRGYHRRDPRRAMCFDRGHRRTHLPASSSPCHWSSPDSSSCPSGAARRGRRGHALPLELVDRRDIRSLRFGLSACRHAAPARGTPACRCGMSARRTRCGRSVFDSTVCI